MRNHPDTKRTLHRFGFNVRFGAAFLGIAALLATTTPVLAAVYSLAPMDLGSGYTLSGAIATNGAQGRLTAADITGWSLKVTAINDIVFTPANTRYIGSGAFLSGGQLLVPTSPDGVSDGGSAAFRGSNRFQVQVADFTGANVRGGQAFYVAGGAFDFLQLHQKNGINALVATEQAPGSLAYDIVARRFSPTTRMTGTLTFAQTSGPAVFTDWNILIRETLSWTFNPGNSAVLSDLGLAAAGNILTVTPFDADANPGSFVIGGFAGGDFNGVLLGDFSYDPGGVAGFQSPFGAFLVSPVPLSAGGDFLVGTAAAVPEPANWSLLIVGFAMIGTVARRRAALG